MSNTVGFFITTNSRWLLTLQNCENKRRYSNQRPLTDVFCLLNLKCISVRHMYLTEQAADNGATETVDQII